MAHLESLTHKRLLISCILYTAVMTLLIFLAFKADGQDGLKVFGSYWASGKAASQGMNPYLPYPLTWVTGVNVVDLNLNPPTVLPLFQLFSSIEPVTSARLWTLFSYLLFIGTLIILLNNRGYASQKRQVIWIFFSPALMDALSLGQIYCFMFAFAVGAWILLERGRHFFAGILIGVLVAIKPNFGLWLLFLMLSGYWRPAIAAGLTVFLLACVAMGLYGIDSYLQWFTAISNDDHAKVYTDVSVHGYFTRVGLSMVGSFLSAILIIGSALWVWWRRLGILDASKLALVVAILSSPLAWFHYTLFLLPAFVYSKWDSLQSAAALFLCVPVFIPVYMMKHGTAWLAPIGGGIYFTGVCLIFASFIVHTGRVPVATLTGPEKAIP